MTEDQAHAVYDVLVTHAGANEDGRVNFVFALSSYSPPEEYRFCGSLGFGGKFRRDRDWVGIRVRQRWYVDCYPEDETPERLHAIAMTNARLAAIKGSSDALAAALKEDS